MASYSFIIFSKEKILQNKRWGYKMFSFIKYSLYITDCCTLKVTLQLRHIGKSSILCYYVYNQLRLSAAHTCGACSRVRASKVSVRPCYNARTISSEMSWRCQCPYFPPPPNSLVWSCVMKCRDKRQCMQRSWTVTWWSITIPIVVKLIILFFILLQLCDNNIY